MSTAAPVPAPFLSPEARDMIRRQLQAAEDRNGGRMYTVDAEIDAYLEVVERTRLDHFARQIMPNGRWNGAQRRNVLSYLVTIDGFRLIAERTGKYAGQVGPYWCGADGVWREVWLSDKPPVAAKLGVLRHDFREPLYAVARWMAYVQTNKEGGVTGMWGKMPDLMLGKVAEALALRRAFPQDLSGLYAVEEMEQAANPKPAEAQHEPRPQEGDRLVAAIVAHEEGRQGNGHAPRQQPAAAAQANPSTSPTPTSAPTAAGPAPATPRTPSGSTVAAPSASPTAADIRGARQRNAEARELLDTLAAMADEAQRARIAQAYKRAMDATSRDQALDVLAKVCGDKVKTPAQVPAAHRR